MSKRDTKTACCAGGVGMSLVVWQRPLIWPEDVSRTPSNERTKSRFDLYPRPDIRLNEEARKMGATQVHMITNLHCHPITLLDQDDDDPGAVVEVFLPGKMIRVAIDKFENARANIVAISKTLEMIRKAEKYGVDNLLTTAVKVIGMPDLKRPWWCDVLGVEPSASKHEIKRAYQRLVLANHPDQGGNTEVMIRILRAYNTACSS